MGNKNMEIRHQEVLMTVSPLSQHFLNKSCYTRKRGSLCEVPKVQCLLARLLESFSF